MKSKHVVVILASAVLIIGMAGIGMAADLGLAWVGKSGMAKRVAAGFEKGSADMGFNVEYQKELASLDDLAALVQKWQGEKKGMVILRSNGAKWLGKNQPTIPTFIGGCNNPVLLGTLKSMEAPEGNITGVTYFLPKGAQFEIFKAIIPDMKSVLLLLAEGNPSSDVDREGTQAVCSILGITYNEKLCATREDATAAASEFSGKVSAIIIGNNALNIDNTANIVGAAGSTPVLAYSDKPVQAGALGGFVADDNKLGMILAEVVNNVIVQGKAVKDVPVQVDPDPKFYVNVKTAEKLGVEIPFNILELATVVE